MLGSLMPGALEYFCLILSDATKTNRSFLIVNISFNFNKQIKAKIRDSNTYFAM